MKNKVYNQRPIELPENELKAWCHLAPFGEFKRIQHNQEITQLCDQQAFETLIANFTDEALVDFEHKSEDSWDTTAAGWAQQLRIGADGLEALIDYTDIGAQAIRNRRHRFLSPVWNLDPNGRPATLLSIGLTNKPYFTLRPILNSTGSLHGRPPISYPRNSVSGATNNPERIHHMDTTQIALALGLPETASADDILAAIKATQAATTTLENRVKELENKQLEDEAQNVADQNEDKIENKDAFKKLYVANKDFALQMLATVKAAPAAAPVTNKGQARVPPAFSGATTTAQNKLEIYEAMPEGKDKAAYLRANAIELNTLRNKRDNA